MDLAVPDPRAAPAPDGARCSPDPPPRAPDYELANAGDTEAWDTSSDGSAEASAGEPDAADRLAWTAKAGETGEPELVATQSEPGMAAASSQQLGSKLCTPPACIRKRKRDAVARTEASTAVQCASCGEVRLMTVSQRRKPLGARWACAGERRGIVRTHRRSNSTRPARTRARWCSRPRTRAPRPAPAATPRCTRGWPARRRPWVAARPPRCP